MTPAVATTGFAILGTGSVADVHQRAITANAALGARLLAVGHHDASRSAEIGGRFGVPCMTQQELLERDDVDVVSICTPSGQHSRQAIAAAEAGKHVIVEKPMALDLGEAEAMISACEHAGVRLGVSLQRRAMSPFQEVRRAIAAGDLGETVLGTATVPYYRSGDYYAQAGWRGTWALDGGGALMNQGIHLLDLLLWYMGDPVEVSASAGTGHRAIEVEDTLASVLTFSNGARASVIATTAAAPGFPHRVEVYGTKGGIQLEGEAVSRWDLTDFEAAAVRPPEPAESPAAGAGADPSGISPDGHAGIYADFIEALHEGRRPLVDGREGRRSVAVTLDIYRSAGLGGPGARPAANS